MNLVLKWQISSLSAAGSQVQRRLRGQNGQAPDFNDVFCRLPALGCRYREISHVAVEEDGFVSVTGVALAPRKENRVSGPAQAGSFEPNFCNA